MIRRAQKAFRTCWLWANPVITHNHVMPSNWQHEVNHINTLNCNNFWHRLSHANNEWDRTSVPASAATVHHSHYPPLTHSFTVTPHLNPPLSEPSSIGSSFDGPKLDPVIFVLNDFFVCHPLFVILLVAVLCSWLSRLTIPPWHPGTKDSSRLSTHHRLGQNATNIIHHRC